MRIQNNQSGVGALGIIIVAGAAFLILLAGWSVFAAMTSNSRENVEDNTPAGQTETDVSEGTSDGRFVRWTVDAGGNWKPVDPNPPTCPVQPMMQAPSSMTYLSLVEYPGTDRHGRYQTTGRLHFNGVKSSDVTVVAPMDATFLRGKRYSVNGEMQYTLDFVNACGVLYRFGHLKQLTSALETIVNAFAETSEYDGKMSNAPDGITIMAGERIATSVGLSKASQTFYDFGVYDLRSPNAQAQDAGYVQRNGKELAGHGVCWFDWIPGSESARVHNATKAQPTSARKSDWCVIDR